VRLFTALIPPQEAVDHLDAFLDVRREAAPFRWTAVEGWHLTLAFMAGVESWRLDELEQRLAVAASRVAPFELRLSGGGAFPDVARAKVLWLGVSTPGELDRLAAGARTAAATAGIEVDGSRFRPHLTLARLTHPIEATRWVRLLDAYDGPAWTATSLALVESHLGEGPRGRPR
jgi:RNA 2',3'-cyclic 3'-phosphodiesterase